MMRVGTQRRSKSSNSSPNTTYRQSPTSSSRLNTPSPINHMTHLNSSYNNKNASYSKYRENASPSFGSSTHKYAQDYHKLTVSENRVSASSPSFDERLRPSSPGPIPRISSPSLAPRAQSPSYNRSQSPDYISSKRLNERRYETSSPSFAKKTEFESNYNNKMSALRVSDSHSPNFVERVSPNPGYSSTSRYDKKVTESRTYNTSSFDQTDTGVDTTPIIKVSGINDRASARRDSWDAIAKTRNILSHRSLESVANLTNSQLDKDIQQRKIEENGRSAQYEQNYSSQTYAQNYSQNYSSNSQNYTVGERVYDSGQRISNKGGGAAAIKVQPVPDGVLGQPVEFESRYK